MVAKIKSGKSLTGALNYNENKVRAGKATLIGASGYAKSDDALSFYDKLFRLKDLAERNIRARTNTVHLSLNFDPTEKLPVETLVNIADDYMTRLGFGDQPYLTYQHADAGHPHIHIVSTNIQPDGKRISLHQIGKLRSEPARKAIEAEFGLIRASAENVREEQLAAPQIVPINYGNTDLKRAITTIVNDVAKNYKFTSLAEFNAILKLYNVNAYSGTKESVMYHNGGLQYWAIDPAGKRIGVPIKASSMYAKPTLKLLNDRYRLNEYLRKPFKEGLKKKIDPVLDRKLSLEQFVAQLNTVGVSVIVRKNPEGRIYGLSYLDHQDKVFFNGSDLGKNYSAAGVIASTPPKEDVELISLARLRTESYDRVAGAREQPGASYSSRTILDELLHDPNPAGNLSGDFGPKKRKKKRKNLNL